MMRWITNKTQRFDYIMRYDCLDSQFVRLRRPLLQKLRRPLLQKLRRPLLQKLLVLRFTQLLINLIETLLTIFINNTKLF
jgi:hypothetical protein